MVTTYDRAVITSRPLQAIDAQLSFRWRCDPATIAAAFHQAAPTAAEHEAWMAARLAGGRHATRLVARDGHLIGMYTVTREAPGRVSLGYMVEPDDRGRGYARLVRAEALEHVRGQMPDVQVVESHIRVENRHSLRVAEWMGAVRKGPPVDGFHRLETRA